MESVKEIFVALMILFGAGYALAIYVLQDNIVWRFMRCLQHIDRIFLLNASFIENIGSYADRNNLGIFVAPTVMIVIVLSQLHSSVRSPMIQFG